jgi:site-specific DNA-cytosine methylase
VYAEPKIKRVDGKPNVYNTDAQAGKVYDVDGISPSVTGQRINSQGFIAEPKDKKVQMNYKANTNANMKERVQDRDETWTLTGNSNDFTITQNHRVRRLTPIECERLQGFKDDWTKGVSDTQRYKMLGNAVTTNVVEYIGRYLK